jgi:hypothetical protein
VEPVVLEGARVRLEPLRADHLADLEQVAFDLPIWQWTIMGPQDAAGLRRWVDTALANQEAGTERPFATIDVASGRAVGSSRYMTIVPEHKRLEIGWTWIGDRVPAHRCQPRGQAAPAHACVRDARREPGRVQDACPQRTVAQRPGRDRGHLRGSLPNHTIMPDGSLRDSAYFSVIAGEWPAVKAALAARLDR